ncbi:MAG: hypothetical protein PHW64_02730 [Sulfuricurvum sp.]|nr:hypothetical protein [Sulfuricurvum sp.]
MRRAAYWLFPLIALAVAVFIVLFLIQINPAAPKLDSLKSEESDSTQTVDEESGSWIDRLSGSEDKGYFYPINEVTLKLDMDRGAVASENYRLSVILKSSYELFCVKEELKKSALPYSMKKEGNTMTLSVDSANQSLLLSLVTKLKTYQITATVSPYTEEK